MKFNKGDEVFIRMTMSVKQLVGCSTVHIFKKTFYKMFIIETVNDYTFNAGDMTFNRLTGCRMVNNSSVIAVKAGTTYCGEIVPDYCQAAEANAYSDKITPLTQYRYLLTTDRANPLNCANVDDALKAHELYQQLIGLTRR